MPRAKGKRFRVHIGYTRDGKDRYRYFESLGLAAAFCNIVFRETKVVLSIVEVKR